MTVDILDMFDKLEDMLDTLNSLRVTWERNSWQQHKLLWRRQSRRHNSLCCCSSFSLKILSSCLTCLTCLLTCRTCLRCPQSCSHTVIYPSNFTLFCYFQYIFPLFHHFLLPLYLLEVLTPSYWRNVVVCSRMSTVGWEGGMESHSQTVVGLLSIVAQRL